MKQMLLVRNPTFYLFLTILLTLEGTELRPSDHGLVYQNLRPTRSENPEMVSFFGESLQNSSNFELPEAKNVTDPSISRHYAMKGEDHLRSLVVVASLVSGLTGVVLLVAAGVLFVLQRQKYREIRHTTYADTIPKRQKLCRMKPELSLKIKEEIGKLLVAGFIEESSYSDRAASIVIIIKKDGRLGIYIDFRDLNNASPKDDFSLPYIDFGLQRDRKPYLILHGWLLWM